MRYYALMIGGKKLFTFACRDGEDEHAKAAIRYREVLGGELGARDYTITCIAPYFERRRPGRPRKSARGDGPVDSSATA